MKNCLALVLIIATISIATCDDSNHADLVQPCGISIDPSCVREFFSKNGHCKVVNKPNERAFYEEKTPIYLPNINLTAVVTKSYVSQMGGLMEKFYFDKKTGNLVISVNFKDLFCEAPETYFAFSQKGKEPKVFTENVNATFPVVLTAIIPGYEEISAESLKKAIYSAYFPNSNALIHPGPKVAESSDPLVASVWKGLQADVPKALKEIFFTKSSFYFLAYLQNYICDFGVKPDLEEYDLTVFDSNNNIEVNKETSFMKPCAGNDDLIACVRKFFGEQSRCSVISHPDEKPVVRKTAIIHVPMNNVSAIIKDEELSGLNGKIEEFYVNKKSGNLVMSVAFDGIIMSTPSIELTIYQRGQQPKYISDSSKIKYFVTLTAVIPTKGGITPESLTKAYVSSYFEKPSEFFKIGSKFTDSKDPQMKEILDGVAAYPTTVGQELLITEAHDYFLAYLQKYVCDFKIPF